MIVVTGAAGFIGSQLINALRRHNYHSLLAVDNFSKSNKKKTASLKTIRKMDLKDFLPWLSSHGRKVEFIFHLGARTDTREKDTQLLHTLNTSYSQQIFTICTAEQIPLLYASSAATYGDGTRGFSDSMQGIDQLQPLNPYGRSKHTFDLWVLKQKQRPYFWTGLKFFNVYGPGESHKGYMASVIYHAYHEILSTGKMRLFKSYRKEYLDGLQARDFVYVKDVVNICLHFMKTRKESGIYNVGTGQAKSFLVLSKYVFQALSLPTRITFIDMPDDIKNTYQYHTEAIVDKLRKAGYTSQYNLESGVTEYIQQYLSNA